MAVRQPLPSISDNELASSQHKALENYISTSDVPERVDDAADLHTFWSEISTSYRSYLDPVAVLREPAGHVFM